MAGNRMYHDLAWLFPYLSPCENYRGEAQELIEAAKQFSRVSVQTLLSLGSGAGHLDHHLLREVQVTGVDISESMNALAQRLNPSARYVLGSMCDVRLNEQFSVSIITDALPYLLTLEDLRAAFRTAWEHTLPGGVFLTYRESDRDLARPDLVRHDTIRYADRSVTHIECYHDPDPTDTTYDMTFITLVRRDGKQTVEVDEQKGGVFAEEVFIQALKDTGFVVQKQHLAIRNIPLYVCQRPAG